MTQLNGHYYKVHSRQGTTVTLYDLFGNPVDGTAFGAWTSGGTTARVFTLVSPYAAADLALLKFVQNVNTLIITHPNYVPYALTYAAPTSWTLSAIVFGTTVSAPINLVSSTTLSGGSVNYSYVVTAFDGNGQESEISIPTTLSNKQDLRTTAGTVTISWDPVSGAAGYNIYKAILDYTGPVAVGGGSR